MTSNDLNEIKSIISELKSEFSKEEERLLNLERERSIRIDELDHQISSARKNEDVDFKFFSPRNTNSSVTEKISGMEDERKKLEQLLSETSRQKNYYTGKTDKLSRVLELLSSETPDSSEKSKDIKFDWFSQFDKDAEDNANLDLETKNELSDDISTDVYVSNTSVANSTDVSDSIDSIVDSNNVIHFEVVSNSVSNNESDSSQNISASNEESYKKSLRDKIAVDFEKTLSDSKEVSKSLNRIIHKAEFGEKIIDNDRRRAHIEIREVIDDLKSLADSL